MQKGRQGWTARGRPFGAAPPLHHPGNRCCCLLLLLLLLHLAAGAEVVGVGGALLSPHCYAGVDASPKRLRTPAGCHCLLLVLGHSAAACSSLGASPPPLFQRGWLVQQRRLCQASCRQGREEWNYYLLRWCRQREKIDWQEALHLIVGWCGRFLFFVVPRQFSQIIGKSNFDS